MRGQRSSAHKATDKKIRGGKEEGLRDLIRGGFRTAAGFSRALHNKLRKNPREPSNKSPSYLSTMSIRRYIAILKQ